MPPRSRRWGSAIADGPHAPRAESHLRQFFGAGTPLPWAGAAGARPRQAGHGLVAADAMLGEEATVAAGVGTIASCAKAAAAGLSTTVVYASCQSHRYGLVFFR